MSEKKHALLSPSSSKMWLECTPSIRLSQDEPNQDSVYAQEGTEAHELCEHKLKLLLGQETENPIPNFKFYSPEMESCAIDYASYVHEVFSKEQEKGLNPTIMIEQVVDISVFAPECFGTAD